jgi:hypothetical protein
LFFYACGAHPPSQGYGEASGVARPTFAGFRRVPSDNAPKSDVGASFSFLVSGFELDTRCKMLITNSVTDVTDVLRMVLRINYLIINSVTDVTDLKRYTYMVIGWEMTNDQGTQGNPKVQCPNA